jgi:uncharacterized protein
MKVILKARVGSHLYGLNHEDSDEDFLGVFIEPSNCLFKMGLQRQTKTSKDPDCSYHELLKFIELIAGKANPTAMELLWCPEYEIITWEGSSLVANRERFLSNKVRYSYGGYAWNQAQKLQKREAEGLEGFNPKVKNRPAKHARHCFRLLRQGKELLEKGTITPKVDNPKEYFALAELSTEELVKKFDEEYNELMTIESVLPDEPDWDWIIPKFLEFWYASRL